MHGIGWYLEMSNEDLPEDTIIDLSQPGVIHYIYPNGKEPGLMDPNVGGYKPKEDTPSHQVL